MSHPIRTVRRMQTPLDLRLAAVAAQQHGVFSAAQAAALGFSRDMMSDRVIAGRWGRMHRGVFRIAGSLPSWDQKLLAAWLAAGNDAVLSHITAGRLHTFPLTDEAIEITIGATARRSRNGIRFHRASELAFVDRCTVGVFVATSPTRTLIDMFPVLRREKFVACVDTAVTKRVTSVPYIRRRISALPKRGRPHLAPLDELLTTRYPHERAPESPLERSLIDLLSELPGDLIIPQHWVQLPNGEWARLDGAWPSEMLAVEGDSYLHHSAPDDWALDGTKRVVLTAMGWRILPFTHFDITTRPRWVLETVARARKLRRAS
ncbi:MAG: hypothetical protein JWO37_2854 [Acidimicrobiales bacterium]|jgi:hypothetical protein|nr:hypothetical protein [Acidimicrobiales bacterium]